MQYALIQRSPSQPQLGDVLNVIVCEPDQLPHLAPDWDHIEALDTLLEQQLGVGIGWQFDLEAQQFIAPPVPDSDASPAKPEAVPMHISVGAFFDRFGAAKWAILSDQAPAVQALVKDCSVRKFIDLARPDLPGALRLIQQAGHALEVDRILRSPIQAEELP